MGVIPLQNTYSATADDCRLCAETRASGVPSGSASRRGRLLVLAVLVSAGLVLSALGGAASWIGVGLLAGMISGALYLFRARLGFNPAAREAHARELREIAEDADSRVNSVIKQFEWAVTDLARIKGQLERSEADVRTLTERAREREHQNEQLVRQISRLRERLAEIAMAASLTGSGKAASRPESEAIPFVWGLHFDGPRTRLELETSTGDVRPTKLRVLDGDGQIVAASGASVVSPGGASEFQVEPPLDLVADLDAGRGTGYSIEALVDEEWRPVRLQDTGRRTSSTVYMGDPLAQVKPAFGSPALTAVRDGRRSALN
jgi:hypothetical protein